jgi:hypothetical protein
LVRRLVIVTFRQRPQLIGSAGRKGVLSLQENGGLRCGTFPFNAGAFGHGTV